MRNERVAIDTNILLYVLGGDKAAHELLKGRDVVASTMVRMEAMVYHGSDMGHLGQVQRFLDRCALEEIHRSIQDRAVDLRLRYRLRLPDAVIATTAVHLGIPLITADKIFSRLKPECEVVLYGK
ncbi:MAG: PIN domain-containing protein [Flavobacteriales bacterium]|nr:PIN domain-containing protein [Flavobacteriales bacterium]MBP7407805.1 PIN domain-containing protein [Flavobacteriales bacterium]